MLLARGETPAARLRTTADTTGLENPGQSGKGRDAQETHASSWSGSGRPSLGINKEKDAGRRVEWGVGWDGWGGGR